MARLGVSRAEKTWRLRTRSARNVCL